MLQRFLDQIAAEDVEKLFTTTHPNIYDAVSALIDTDDVKELEKTLRHFFEQVIQINPPNSKQSFEARRMLTVCDRIFNLEGENREKSAIATNRDMNDEIADFYVESLKHFSSTIQDPVLYEHIKYLEDNTEWKEQFQ